MRLNYVLVVCLFFLSERAHSDFENATSVCSEQEIESQLKSQKGRKIFSTGPNKYFLVLPKPIDIARMADRVYAHDTTGKVNPKHQYDKGMDGIALDSVKYVAFFNHTENGQPIALTPEESSLKQALLKSGLLVEKAGRVEAPRVFALGFAERGADKGTVGHEMNHMDFDTNPAYRTGVMEYLDSMTEKETNLVRHILTKIGYGNVLNNRDHFAGEFAAFFRDLKTLKGEYGESIGNVDWKSVEEMSARLKRIEASRVKIPESCRREGVTKKEHQ